MSGTERRILEFEAQMAGELIGGDELAHLIPANRPEISTEVVTSGLYETDPDRDWNETEQIAMSARAVSGHRMPGRGAGGPQSNTDAKKSDPKPMRKIPATPADRDMRPIFNIQAFSGVYSDENIYGLNGDWFAHGDHASAVSWLIAQLDEGYDRGSRILHIRPICGHMRGEQMMAHAMWFVEGMPKAKRIQLAPRLVRWMADHEDAVIELHTNAMIAAWNTQMQNSHPDFRNVDMTRTEDRELMKRTMGIWIQLAQASGGQIGFSMDAASSPARRDEWLRIMNTLAIAGVPMRGEALPVRTDKTGLCTPHIEAHDWWALDFDNNKVVRNIEREIGLGKRTMVCERGQLLTVGLGKGVGLDGQNDHQVSLVEHYMRRGWRVHPWHPTIIDEAWRVYRMLCQEHGHTDD